MWNQIACNDVASVDILMWVPSLSILLQVCNNNHDVNLAVKTESRISKIV